jgi:hypothetical protein
LAFRADIAASRRLLAMAGFNRVFRVLRTAANGGRALRGGLLPPFSPAPCRLPLKKVASFAAKRV